MKKGNLVRCIRGLKTPFYEIKKGSLYTVKSYSGGFVQLVENNHKTLFGCDYFEVVPDLLSDPKKDEGTKADAGKPRISLIPQCALWGMANALTYGERKYGTHNFRSGLSYSRLADACYRHLSAYMEGEDIDEESGNCHLDHAMASLAMLKYMTVHRKEKDDRPKGDS